MTNQKKILPLLALSIALPAYSANWLMLQGTEPEGAAGRAKVWGFVQPEYVQTGDTPIEAGPWAGQKAIFNQNRPDNVSDEFNVRRARIGVRGVGFPLDPKVNYFMLAEFGNNGITKSGGGSAKITDMSVTANHIKGARIRVGQFKFPGSEEALRAIHVANYNNFSNFTNQMLLERFFDGTGGARQSGIDHDNNATTTRIADPNADINALNGPVGAFRDIGIQVFDTFKQDNGWEYSYAAMIGNGNGIARGDNDDNKDTYLYGSAEKVYSGKGARRNHLKLFAWTHSGKRTLTKEDAGEYDRNRAGIGVTYSKGKYRAGAEYMNAEGMIFNGTDGGALPGAVAGATGRVGETAGFNISTEGKADGYYLHFGYRIKPNLELNIRHDELNRLTDNTVNERKFTTTTLGAQYFFNKKSRVTLNYELRDAKAPGQAGNSGANQILSGIDDRISAQLLFIF